MIQQTSTQAYNSINNKELKRATVYKAIKESNGLTLFELSEKLQWPVNRITGRIAELRDKCLIVDTGIKRKNPTGKSAIVWGVVNGIV